MIEHAADIVPQIKPGTMLSFLVHGLWLIAGAAWIWYWVGTKRRRARLEWFVACASELAVKIITARERLAGTRISSTVDSQPRQVPEPPRVAEFLVGLFAKKRYRNGLRQNLEEDFNKDIASGISIRRARSRYWSAALNSVGPQFWRFIKRIGLVAAVAEFARRLLH